ncbi:putative alcohol oxidase [Nemania sp. FL0916]|nr:putative alcohol oxidase [Nemania sp. FL0916]
MFNRLHSLLCVLIFALPPSRSVASPGTQPFCRCFPGDPCWPSEPAWNALNRTIGGNLIQTVPLANVCHGKHYNQQACDNLKATWFEPVTHYQSSSSVMAPFFTNNSCNPFLSRQSPCIVGAYTQYAVNATSVSHYQATLKFAAQHNIRLVIRNTGHDFLGKSTGPGALALWTHSFKKIDVLDYKSPHYNGPALRITAGVQLMDAYQAAHDSGLVVVGGTCPTVGVAGGYTQGAGHGLLASSLGLGADQALEWEVVTSDGVFRRASPSINPDLYWALTGGGGGTYGLVVALTVRAYPDRTTSAANLTFSNEGVSQDTFFEGIRAYVIGLPSVLDAGATSIWFNTNKTFTLSPAVGFGMTKKALDALHQPVLDKLDSLNVSYVYISREYPTYLDMFNAMNPFTETAIYQIGSRLIPRKVVLDNFAKSFIATLREISTIDGGIILGPSFHVSKPPPVPNAVNPAFRDALVNLVVATLYDYLHPEANLANQKLMTDTIVPRLKKIIPGGGYAYLNEADPWEPEWRTVFYGDNYNKLLGIKNKYDPDQILYARTAVGSDSWVESADGRLCQVRTG